VYSCNALSARFFDVDRALNSYFMIIIMIAKLRNYFIMILPIFTSKNEKIH